MRYFIICISLFFSFGLSAQETSSTNKVRLGVNLSSTFSRQWANGLTPALSLSMGQHYVSFGPRIAFWDISRGNFPWDKHIFLDFNYRYYPLKDLKKIKPFAQFTTEFERTWYKNEGIFDHEGGPYASGPYFPYSFKYKSESSYQHLNFYLGAGTEFMLSNKLSANVNGGLGLKFSSSKRRLVDTEKNEVLIDDKNQLHPDDISWLLSFGLSYKF